MVPAASDSVLMRTHLCVPQVKELGRADEVLDLSDYERCEEIRKNKSRSKKNHSKFRLQRCSMPGNTVRLHTPVCLHTWTHTCLSVCTPAHTPVCLHTCLTLALSV